MNIQTTFVESSTLFEYCTPLINDTFNTGYDLLRSISCLSSHEQCQVVVIQTANGKKLQAMLGIGQTIYSITLLLLPPYNTTCGSILHKKRTGRWREWREWSKHGYKDLLYDGYYDNGERTGYWRYYLEHKIVFQEGYYQHDKRVGHWQHRWTIMDNKAKFLQEEGDYNENGLQTGHWRTWHANGSIWCKGDFKEGKQVGWWQWWDENGRIQRERLYPDEN